MSVTRGDVVAASLEPGPAWLARARPTGSLDPVGAPRIDGEAADPQLARIVHTSGTGGAPRFAQFDRRAIDAAVASSASALGASDRDRWL